MEKRRRRAYADDYKQRAVDLVVSSGRSAGSVARELGLHESILCRWMAERGSSRAQADGSAAAPKAQAALPSADQAAEIARLQQENERLRMERDILKKSIAIFAGVRT
jgi:transposase